MTTTAIDKKGPDLPDPVARRGITEPQWRTLCNSLYPGADPQSVLLVWDYCVARHLDPLKKPVHVVPMEVRNSKTGKYEWKDCILPGIYEYRTTAQRTGLYLGHSKPAYGPTLKQSGVEAPEWCEFVVYRWNVTASQRVEYPVRVYFREVVGTTREGKANPRWQRAPIQMLEKCTEAKGLREAFPDELGGETTAEEMDGQRAIEITAEELIKPVLVKPEKYDDWVTDLTAAADLGEAALVTAYKESPEPLRLYLAATEPEAWDAIKLRAVEADAKGSAS